MEETDALEALAAIAHAARLRVFRALVVAGHDGLTPGALAASLGLVGNTLSFHLKALAHAELVHAERHGRYLIYRANYARMRALMDYLSAHCCEGQPCGIDPAPAPNVVCAC
jgi:DNA-binding transcriptional ArsR family regulator